jgi:hypothetical protein
MVKKRHGPTITGQLLADWSSSDFKNDTSCGHPEKKAINNFEFHGYSA